MLKIVCINYTLIVFFFQAWGQIFKIQIKILEYKIQIQSAQMYLNYKYDTS